MIDGRRRAARAAHSGGRAHGRGRSTSPTRASALREIRPAQGDRGAPGIASMALARAKPTRARPPSACRGRSRCTTPSSLSSAGCSAPPAEARGNVAAAARALDMDRGQLSRLMRKHSLDRAAFRATGPEPNRGRKTRKSRGRLSRAKEPRRGGRSTSGRAPDPGPLTRGTHETDPDCRLLCPGRLLRRRPRTARRRVRRRSPSRRRPRPSSSIRPPRRGSRCSRRGSRIRSRSSVTAPSPGSRKSASPRCRR